MTISTDYEQVALSRITQLSPLNPRQDMESDVSQLAATIRAIGQQYPILLRPIPDDAGGAFEVIDGGRRWRAQRLLQAETPDAPIFVPARICEADEDAAREAGVVIAVSGAPLHPVEQYESFAALAREGATVERIAATFGLTPREVRQRLALGDLHETIRGMWRRDEIDAGAAREWAKAPLAAQTALIEKWRAEGGHSGRWNDAHAIRRELSLGRVSSRDARARLILANPARTDAYRALGGRIEDNLFEDEIELLDAPILDAVVTQALQDAADAAARAEGWGEGNAEADDDALLKEDPDYTDEEIARLEELDVLQSAPQSDMPAIYDEIDAIERAAWLRTLPPERRRAFAIVAWLDGAGIIRLQRGVEIAREADGQTPQPSATDSDTTSAAEQPPPEDDAEKHEGPPAGDEVAPHDPGAEPSKALRRVIDDTLDAALFEAARRRPDIGMTLIVAALGCAYGVNGVQVQPPLVPQEAHCDLLRRIRELTFEDALQAAAQAPLADLSAAFAEVAATIVNPAACALDTIGAICAAMRWRGAPLATHFSAHLDREAFFDAAPKKTTAAIVAGLIGENEARRVGRMKADERARHAARLSQDKGHLPAPFADWAGLPESPTADADAMRIDDAPSLAGAMAEAIARDDESETS